MGKELWEETLHDIITESVQECINTYAIPGIYEWLVFKSCPAPENKEEVLQDAKDDWLKVLTYVQSIAEKRKKKYIIGDEVKHKE